VETVARDGNCLFKSLSILLEDGGQYHRLRQKQYNILYVVSEGQIIQLKKSKSCPTARHLDLGTRWG
jgi:hypothetical protein